MRILFTLLLIGLCFGPGSAQLELVESFPSETDFDQADIRDTQEVWLELINDAESEILWHTFYLAHEKGKATEPVLKALKKAAKRGVKVQMLVDEKFRGTYPEPLKSLNELKNIEVRSSPIGRWYGGVMHAKMILVDGERGFIGSQNFDWRSLEHIRELGVLFRDTPLVSQYRRVFLWEWKHFDKPEQPDTLPSVESELMQVGGEFVMVTASPNGANEKAETGDEHQIISLINQADTSVEVALLSYSPVNRDGKTFYPELDNALRAAATRGVKVRLLLSHWVEKKKTIDHLLSLDKLKNVEIRACRIPEASEGEIPFARVHHSKYLVIDGGESAWLGTSNWSRGYFHNSRNYGMVFWSPRIPSRLHTLFDFDWERSTSLVPVSK